MKFKDYLSLKLRDGMLITLRDGKEGVYFKDCIFIPKYAPISIYDYKEFDHITDKEFDIVEVNLKTLKGNELYWQRDTNWWKVQKGDKIYVHEYFSKYGTEKIFLRYWLGKVFYCDNVQPYFPDMIDADRCELKTLYYLD